jgi:hypothetical protein
MATPSWLARAAARGADHPWTFGAVVAAYCEIEGCSPDDLAARLDCTPDTLMWISLCRCPAGGAFADQIQSIASKFNVPAGELAAIVRRADAIGVLRSSDETAQELIAARDRAGDDGEDL